MLQKNHWCQHLYSVHSKYGTILLSFQDITTGQTDVTLQPMHICRRLLSWGCPSPTKKWHVYQKSQKWWTEDWLAVIHLVILKTKQESPIFTTNTISYVLMTAFVKTFKFSTLKDNQSINKSIISVRSVGSSTPNLKVNTRICKYVSLRWASYYSIICKQLNDQACWSVGKTYLSELNMLNCQHSSKPGFYLFVVDTTYHRFR